MQRNSLSNVMINAPILPVTQVLISIHSQNRHKKSPCHVPGQDESEALCCESSLGERQRGVGGGGTFPGAHCMPLSPAPCSSLRVLRVDPERPPPHITPGWGAAAAVM